jgi:hypothetical protein
MKHTFQRCKSESQLQLCRIQSLFGHYLLAMSGGWHVNETYDWLGKKAVCETEGKWVPAESEIEALEATACFDWSGSRLLQAEKDLLLQAISLCKLYAPTAAAPKAEPDRNCLFSSVIIG